MQQLIDGWILLIKQTDDISLSNGKGHWPGGGGHLAVQRITKYFKLFALGLNLRIKTVLPLDDAVLHMFDSQRRTEHCLNLKW